MASVKSISFSKIEVHILSSLMDRYYLLIESDASMALGDFHSMGYTRQDLSRAVKDVLLLKSKLNYEKNENDREG